MTADGGGEGGWGGSCNSLDTGEGPRAEYFSFPANTKMGKQEVARKGTMKSGRILKDTLKI
jgi:hypothetical protein